MPAPVHALGPPFLGYGYSHRLLPWLKAHVREFDAVIVHGLWQYHGLAVHRASRQPDAPPYFVFSHGMLDPWFKHRYPLKHLKKSMYWWLGERRILVDAAAVLFTCEEERRLARPSFPASSYAERVVAFGTATPPTNISAQQQAFFERVPSLRDRPYWLFLGRIHPKKGVDLLIDAYGQLAAQAPLPHLVIAGPCADTGYLQQLQDRAAACCPAGKVEWPGMLNGEVKWGALRGAEVFVLASHQENFGIAVVESLACGTPVLISNQVNIWREIAADGAGLVEPDTAEGTFRLLGRWQTLDNDARRAMRAAAAKSFVERYEVGAASRSLAATIAPFLK